MGVPDNSLLELIDKVRSWVSWGTSNPTTLSSEFRMSDNISEMCCGCELSFKDTCLKYHCRSCGRMLCANCIWIYGSSGALFGETKGTVDAGVDIKCCKFCSEISIRNQRGGKYSDKIYPSESPRQSPEPQSPCFSGGRLDDYSPDAMRSSVTSVTGHPSPVSVYRSPSRSDEEEAEDSATILFSSSSEYCNDTSDIDSSSISARHEFYSFKSVGSSPSDSPSRIHISSNRVGHSVHKGQGETPTSQHGGHFDKMAVLTRQERGTGDPDNTHDCADDLSVFRDQYEKLQKPLDFENNGLIWFPPPPEDEDYEAENNFFAYDDDEDEIGDSGVEFSSSSSLAGIFPAKEKSNEGHKEPLRAVVQGHFRALVSQLLQGEGIKVGKENSTEDWLDIVTTVAWQAANFVRPDTSRGGSMDPGDYVKVKCIASGSPSESAFVKGVVCTKNIKHKRMTSQYKTPRLLILGGALEYQRVPNQLSSFETLLQQEIEHLKMIVSKIEAQHRPNVLLVEKSVSSYAQEYLLERDISLVLNIKRPLLERIARCTGALITPSMDSISTTRLGHCELFRLERVSEELEKANQASKKTSKTLMFFEGCPRRLGCTVLLKGSCLEELKKVKHVVQYAVFAAYHLSLETSFLADEGASLPKMKMKPSIAILERTLDDIPISVISDSVSPINYQAVADDQDIDKRFARLNLDLGEGRSLLEHRKSGHNLFPTLMECDVGYDAHNDNLASNVPLEDVKGLSLFPSEIGSHVQQELLETADLEEKLPQENFEMKGPDRVDENDLSSEYYSATESHQSILVSFSSCCVLNGTVCERSRLLRIKFYGCFDKPLGRYLQDDLFDQTSSCRSCKEPVDAHVSCYTHQQGNLTINVRCIPSVKLAGERDGKIWMWHRCLRCAQVDGVPPATRRVVMSDAAWGLSFGKFLELSFSNHATANRVASCGHSLQKDCLRYYGFGSMVAFFRYSPIDILSVRLPPSMLEFSGHVQQEWIRKEATELLSKMEALYKDLSTILSSIERNISLGFEKYDASELRDHIMQLNDLLIKESSDYKALLQTACEETSAADQTSVDILGINCLRRSLVIGSHVWDRRLYSLDALLKKRRLGSEVTLGSTSFTELKEWRSDSCSMGISIERDHEENVSESSKLHEFSKNAIHSEQEDEPNSLPSDPSDPEENISAPCQHYKQDELQSDCEFTVGMASLDNAPSTASNLSDKIDSAWTGTDPLPLKAQLILLEDGPQFGSVRHINQADNPTFRRMLSPSRVYSFDSALRLQERIRKGLSPSSLHLSTLRSFHAYGEYRSMVRDPVSNVRRTCSQISPREAQKLNLLLHSTPSFISSASLVPDGARLLLPQTGQIVIAVYDNEPASIISYVISSKDYEDWIADRPNGHERSWNAGGINGENSAASSFSPWKSFRSLDLDFIHYGSYGSDDASSSISSLLTDSKTSPHLRISFEDESLTGGKLKFSVTCYFAKQFDALRKKCCPSEVDFVRSLSRCKRWSAQGGKSNVYFGRSLDGRLIIKQVQKTELESFEEFAPEYFKYLTDPLSSGSPTCLAKILGIFQVTVKNLKGGKETKMDLMVMENLFFKRSISRVYDLKGSLRSRYNADPTGSDKVLLDMNLLETLRTKPIFLGSKAKRRLERAVWNDTSFLASVDVMDYSLLVGVDDERKELVIGIIDFMRQYTWDKHLETWVKASGILGGPKNASPTIISPKQYKKRFRKAMTTYFLTVPDQWSW